jgi:hypothetical protein
MRKNDKILLKASNGLFEAIATICREYEKRAEKKMSKLNKIDIEVKTLKKRL